MTNQLCCLSTRQCPAVKQHKLNFVRTRYHSEWQSCVNQHNAVEWIWIPFCLQTLACRPRLKPRPKPTLKHALQQTVRQRVQFKLAVLVFKALHGQAPQRLTDDCQLVAAAGRRQLRSSDAVTCLVPRTRTCLGDRAFGVAWPRLPWTVSTGAKNAFIWLCLQGLVTFCF